MPIERDKYLKIWTHDAGHARHFFGFPENRPVHILKDGPTTPDEKREHDPSAKLFAVLAHEPRDYEGTGTLTNEELAGLINTQFEESEQEQLRRLNGTLPEDQWDIE